MTVNYVRIDGKSLMAKENTRTDTSRKYQKRGQQQNVAGKAVNPGFSEEESDLDDLTYKLEVKK